MGSLFGGNTSTDVAPQLINNRTTIGMDALTLKSTGDTYDSTKQKNKSVIKKKLGAKSLQIPLQATAATTGVNIKNNKTTGIKI